MENEWSRQGIPAEHQLEGRLFELVTQTIQEANIALLAQNQAEDSYLVADLAVGIALENRVALGRAGAMDAIFLPHDSEGKPIQYRLPPGEQPGLGNDLQTDIAPLTLTLSPGDSLLVGTTRLCQALQAALFDEQDASERTGAQAESWGARILRELQQGSYPPPTAVILGNRPASSKGRGEWRRKEF